MRHELTVGLAVHLIVVGHPVALLIGDRFLATLSVMMNRGRMRYLSLLGFVFLLISSVVSAQNVLERMLQCDQKPNPTALVLAMKKFGIIDDNPVGAVDSIPFWRPAQPITVWGYKVKAIFAFDQNPELFPRIPIGTAPPILIGVVVPYPLDRVRAHVQTLGYTRVTVESRMEFESISVKEDTWITCYGGV